MNIRKTFIFCICVYFSIPIQIVLSEVFDVKPSSQLEPTLNVITGVKNAYPDSVMAKTQIELWLSQLSVAELEALKKSIPSPWRVSKLGGLAWNSGIKDHIEHVLLMHPELENPIELGRKAANENLQIALKNAAAIEDIETRRLYLIGICFSSGRLETFKDVYELRKEISPQLSNDQQHRYMIYGRDRWMYQWPADSIAAYATTLDEDSNFSFIRYVCDAGSMYFSSYEEGEKYLKHFGRSAIGQAPVIAESMGSIRAARNPEEFIKWFITLSADRKSFAISEAIEPLLRNDLQYVHQLLPSFEDSAYAGGRDIAIEWARYDRESAEKWAAQLPDYKKFGKSFIFGNGANEERLRIADMVKISAKASLEIQRPKKVGKGVLTIKELANLAHPGASPLANQSLYEAIFSLEKMEVIFLLKEFRKNSPTNAKEVLVNHYLLESWVLYESEIACDWILESGNGMMRELLPLAFAKMSHGNLKESTDRLKKIPEEHIYYQCSQVLDIEFKDSKKTD